MTTPTIFTIAEDLRKMQVNTNVSEGDVGRLEVGQPTTFTVDAFPGRNFKGVISQIRNAATVVSNVVTYDAVIDVDNSDLKLRPGMTANATVSFAERGRRGEHSQCSPALQAAAGGARADERRRRRRSRTAPAPRSRRR